MQKNLYIIGIDCGRNGGIVAIANNKIVDISPMPSSPKLLREHFLFLGLPHNYRGEMSIFIENVHSMPTDGSRAAFTFGKGLGHLEGVLACMGFYDPLRVNPATWQKYFKLKRDIKGNESRYNFKKRMKEKAIKECPKNYRKYITMKTCDAYLITLYGNKLKLDDGASISS